MSGSPRRPTTRKEMRLQLTKERLQTLYWKWGLSARQIADRFSVDRKYILARMELLGIPRRPANGRGTV